jgi:hypothetical protein
LDLWAKDCFFFALIKETYEKQMKVLINENEKSKRNSLQMEGIIGQLKRENEELQQKVRFYSNYRDSSDFLL